VVFVMLDMEEDYNNLFLVSRPFLDTGISMIDMEMRELMLRFQNEHVTFDVFEALQF